MGGGNWTSDAYATYANTTNLKSLHTKDVFARRSMDTRYDAVTQQVVKDKSKFDPTGVTVRESRDSDDHPNSNAIILALDVTGSMGKYAHEIAVEHLPDVMRKIMDSQIVSDPQIMFMGIDDIHTYSQAPLQVSQFESDIRIVEQLRDIYLVGGGGGNDSESYDLAWYFAGRHTDIDCWNKRSQPGFLFTFGDECAPYEKVSGYKLDGLLGGETGRLSYEPEDMLKLAQEKYHVFHIIIEQGDYCKYNLDKVRKTWVDLLGNNAIFLCDTKDLSDVITATIRIANGDDIDTVLDESGCRKELEYALQIMLFGDKKD